MATTTHRFSKGKNKAFGFLVGTILVVGLVLSDKWTPFCLSAGSFDPTVTLVSVRNTTARVSDILFAIAEGAGLDFVLPSDDDILGKTVTVNYQNAPLSRVLDELASSTGFTWHIDGISLLVAAQGGNLVSSVSVPLQATTVDDLLDTIAGNAAFNGKVTFTPDRTHNAFIVSGPRNLLASAKDFIRQLDECPARIGVDVVFIEIRMTENGDNGTTWTWNDFTFSEMPVATSGFGDGTTSRVAALGKFQRNPLILNAKLQAAIKNGSAKVLSNTRLLTQTGKPVRLANGQDYPIVLQKENGPEIEFKPTGIQIELIAIALGNDTIRMALKPSISEITGYVETEVSDAPIIARREPDTILTVANGEWFVVSGLISERSTVNKGGVPLLKDLPLVGGAFKNDSTTKERTQTVIMVRPFLADTPQEVPTLGDDLGTLGIPRSDDTVAKLFRRATSGDIAIDSPDMDEEVLPVEHSGPVVPQGIFAPRSASDVESWMKKNSGSDGERK